MTCCTPSQRHNASLSRCNLTHPGLASCFWVQPQPQPQQPQRRPIPAGDCRNLPPASPRSVFAMNCSVCSFTSQRLSDLQSTVSFDIISGFRFELARMV